MKSIITISLTLISGLLLAQESEVARVTAEHIYRYQIVNTSKYLPTWGNPETKETKPELTSGTCFAVKYKDQSFIITAAHVLIGTWSVPVIAPDGPSGPQYVIVDDKVPDSVKYAAKLVNATTRIRVGDLSIVPKKMYLNNAGDFAVIPVSPRELALIGVRALSYEENDIQLNMVCSAWGFPSTSSPQQSSEWKVTDIPSVKFFTLQGSLTHGYSGGPILSGGKGVGIVSRDDGKQASGIPIGKAIMVIKNISSVYMSYSDGIKIADLAAMVKEN